MHFLFSGTNREDSRLSLAGRLVGVVCSKLFVVTRLCREEEEGAVM